VPPDLPLEAEEHHVDQELPAQLALFQVLGHHLDERREGAGDPFAVRLVAAHAVGLVHLFAVRRRQRQRADGQTQNQDQGFSSPSPPRGIIGEAEERGLRDLRKRLKPSP